MENVFRQDNPVKPAKPTDYERHSRAVEYNAEIHQLLAIMPH